MNKFPNKCHTVPKPFWNRLEEYIQNIYPYMAPPVGPGRVGVEHFMVLKMLHMKVNVVIITNSIHYNSKHDSMWYKSNNIDFH